MRIKWNSCIEMRRYKAVAVSPVQESRNRLSYRETRYQGQIITKQTALFHGVDI